MPRRLVSSTNALLIGLVLLDLSLSITALFFPALWIRLMHGIPAADALGLVRRLGANWAAFFLCQAVALWRWEREPYWLAVVAGVRFTELFCDWVYLGAAGGVTPFGRIGLLLSPPVNILAGWFLLRRYRRLAASLPARGNSC